MRDHTMRPHRLIAHILIRPLRDVDVIAHRCDNPQCVNPEHLFITTAAGNMADRDAKGRNTKGYTREDCHKLTYDQVRAIRAAHATGASVQGMSDIYKTSPAALWKVIKRKSYRNVY